VALPLQLLGLPGTWLLAADVLLFRWIMGPDFIDYHTVIILGLMALLAEALEFMTAVKGARSGPPVRGAAVASIVGAFAGGLAGAPVLFGLGAIPGMAIGAWLAVFCWRCYTCCGVSDRFGGYDGQDQGDSPQDDRGCGHGCGDHHFTGILKI